MKKSLLVLAIAAVVMIAGTAMATPINFSQGNYTATLTVGSGTATLLLGSSPNTAFWTDNVAIKAGGRSFTLTSASASSGTWTFGSNYPDTQACTNLSNGDGLCAVSATNVAGNGLSFTWNFTGGATASDTWSIQFYICSSASPACDTGSSNFVSNFSQSGGTTTTPEPASIALLGAGLVGLGGLIRRRK